MSLMSIQEICDAKISSAMVEQNLRMIMNRMDAYNDAEDPEDVDMVSVGKDINSTLSIIDGVNSGFFTKLSTKTLLKIGE